MFVLLMNEVTQECVDNGEMAERCVKVTTNSIRTTLPCTGDKYLIRFTLSCDYHLLANEPDPLSKRKSVCHLLSFSVSPSISTPWKIHTSIPHEAKAKAKRSALGAC